MDLVIVCTWLLALFFLCFLFSVARAPNRPPGPAGLPVLGHLHLLARPLHRALAALADRHGPLLFLRLGFRPAVVVSSPALAAACLSTNDASFASRPLFLLGRILGYGNTSLAFAPYGPHWRNLRRVASVHMLSAARVATFSSVRADEARLLVRRLRGLTPGPVKLKDELHALTVNVMMRAMAGKRYYDGGDAAAEGEGEAGRFRELLKETTEAASTTNLGDFFPVLDWLDAQGNKRKFERVQAKRNSFMQEIVDEFRRRRRTRSAGARDDKQRRDTMVDVLLDLQEEEPQYYTDDVVKGFITQFLVVGTDTSALTMEWVMTLLLKHPEVLEKARAEIDAVVGNRRLVEESDMPRLPFLHGIILETLRLFPIAPLLVPHESIQECTLDGFAVPPGTMLVVNVWAIQRDPSVWDDPLAFKPERFVDGASSMDGFKYLPFGSGRRSCPGENHAMHVMEITLGCLIQCFDWEHHGPEEVDLKEGSGVAMDKAVPLKAICKPRSLIFHLE